MTTHFIKTSYGTEVQFLMEESSSEFVTVAEKEEMVASGQGHYSEVVVKESAPSKDHTEAFKKSLATHGKSIAQNVESLAKGIIEQAVPNKDVVIVSLVRAGTPLGCLIKRGIDSNIAPHLSCHHYSVSIVLSKGIDVFAMDFITEKHGAENIFFVDGWTGKGAISKELQSSLASYTPKIEPRLVVLADPCGFSWMSPTTHDWLIPFGIMNSVISGLTSRSMLPKDHIGFHQCKIMDHLINEDISSDFLNHIDFLRKRIEDPVAPCKPFTEDERLRLGKRLAALDYVVEKFGAESASNLKPGIAEATRAVMRRIPKMIIVDSLENNDLSLLLTLAKENDIKVVEEGDKIAPYSAITLVK